MKNTVLTLAIGFFIGKAYSRYYIEKKAKKREQMIMQRTTKNLKDQDFSIDEITDQLQYIFKK